MKKSNFDNVSMTRDWGSLKHGAIVSLDVLAITQAREFIAHTAQVLEGETDGVAPIDAPHLWGALDKATAALDLLGALLDTAADEGLDAKLKRCTEHVAFKVNCYESGTRAEAMRLAVRLANGERGVDVSKIPTREAELATEKLEYLEVAKGIAKKQGYKLVKSEVTNEGK